MISVVSYSLVQQASLASTEYPKGVNEFIKAGLTPVPSKMVKPFCVKESPVNMECAVRDVIELGSNGGAGNLIICEILLMHINENVLNAEKFIDPDKIDLVGRMGGNWYCRASGNAKFEVVKPLQTPGIGVDRIPEAIRNSNILTGNDLGQLGNVPAIPSEEEVNVFKNSEAFRSMGSLVTTEAFHSAAKSLLESGKVNEAWKTLLAFNQ